MKLSAFPEQGRFYKGNLHAHTTRSDGRTPPAALVKLYQDHGYDFTAITDHNVYSYNRDLCTDSFVVLPGIETHITCPDHKGFHVVGIGRDDASNGFDEGERMVNPTYTGPESPQRLVDRLLERGNLAIHAHPRWSLLEFADCSLLSGHIAMEIQNSVCYMMNNTGNADAYYDYMLMRGHRLFCVGSDDTHQKRHFDYCRTRTVVKAQKLSVGAIFDALLAGHFYASEGPEIEDFVYEDGVVSLFCSPCREIHFMAYPDRGYSYPDFDTLKTFARWPVSKNCDYVRAVCVDAEGKKAWTNPIYLK